MINANLIGENVIDFPKLFFRHIWEKSKVSAQSVSDFFFLKYYKNYKRKTFQQLPTA